MLVGNGTPSAAGNTPQSLEQLLERQWEQGSQFLMEQAQHFDSTILFLVHCMFFLLIFYNFFFSCIVTLMSAPVEN